MLEVKNLSVKYDKLVAVNAVSFSIAGGEVAALVGSNGAGKSSILKGLLGIAPSTGSVCVDNKSVNDMRSHHRVSAGIALSPEGRHVFPQLTVRENLVVGYREQSTSCTQMIEEMFALFPKLAERTRQLAGTMSGGEQQMVAIARALMSKPKVLMLDEPTLGLAPLIVRDLAVLIRNLAKNGLAILLAEQNAEFALACSDRAYVLETGRVIQEGESFRLARDPQIAAAYLGM